MRVLAWSLVALPVAGLVVGAVALAGGHIGLGLSFWLCFTIAPVAGFAMAGAKEES